MSESITTVEIRVARVITAEGRMAFKVSTPLNFNAVEVLGLLEAAKLQIFRDLLDGKEYR